MTFITKKIGNIISHIFFFFNSLFLPTPLLFTNFLSLYYIKQLIKWRFVKYYLVAVLILTFYTIIHIYTGVEKQYYFETLTYVLMLCISIGATVLFIENFSFKLEKIFKTIALSSFILFVIALIFLIMPFESPFWKFHNFISDGKEFYRYQGLSYEPSYYALVFSPVLLYFLLKLLLIEVKIYTAYLMAVCIPIIFTYSFGFFGVLLVSLIVSLIIIVSVHRFFPKKLILPFIVIFLSIGGVMLNENFLSKRIDVILEGNDTSINGRTYEAFYLSSKMAQEKSIWFGIGLGQIKVVGEKYIRGFYGYDKNKWPVVAIPNASAETLAIYGLSGLVLRIVFQLFLFVRFKVYQNYFNLTFFSFLFIYQFMGSYITSTTEYSLWVLAVLPVFKEFEIVIPK